MTRRLVVLSGPSGVGKDTVIDAWARRDPQVKRVVAYTTRPPRPGEHDGDDYHFVDPERFDRLATEGAFLEAKNVHGNWYATPLADMEEMLDAGLVAVLKIDVQGALVAMERFPWALTVMLAPPSAEELERRIRGRGTDAEEVVAKRLANARGELAQADRYQHVVVNRDVDEAVEEIMGLVEARWPR
ncbi:MAG: guanylate kinase [Fimbriimonadaceae bacterium]|nr:guanylate kinase [Fimbriimonadaceae bacterium]